MHSASFHSEEGDTPTPADGTTPLTALQSGIARGKLGKALFSSQSVLEAVPEDPRDFPGPCLAMEMAGAPVTITMILTYNDGSILSLVAGDDAYYCSDGTVFTVGGLGGDITGGEGRFEGAEGSWDGTARSEGGRVTAEITVELERSHPSHGHGDRH